MCDTHCLCVAHTACVWQEAGNKGVGRGTLWTLQMHGQVTSAQFWVYKYTSGRRKEKVNWMLKFVFLCSPTSFCTWNGFRVWLVCFRSPYEMVTASIGNPILLCLFISRKPRFILVLYDVRRLLPALHYQADQLLVLTCISEADLTFQFFPFFILLCS